MARSTIRLAVHGAKGRMGTRVCALAREDPRFELVASIDVDGPPMRREDMRGTSIDAVIDFSSDAGATSAISLAVERRAALLIGTTALAQSTLAAVDEAARSIAVMVCANTSPGVAVLTHLAAEAARLLGPSFQIELTETHHTGKKDAPSGTARQLVAALKDRSGVELPPQKVHSIRQGEVIGEHSLQFTGQGEIVQVSHVATNRDVFALGALRAMAWLQPQKPGRYTIEQSLGMGG